MGFRTILSFPSRGGNDYSTPARKSLMALPENRSPKGHNARSVATSPHKPHGLLTSSPGAWDPASAVYSNNGFGPIPPPRYRGRKQCGPSAPVSCNLSPHRRRTTPTVL